MISVVQPQHKLQTAVVTDVLWLLNWNHDGQTGHAHNKHGLGHRSNMLRTYASVSSHPTHSLTPPPAARVTFTVWLTRRGEHPAASMVAGSLLQSSEISRTITDFLVSTRAQWWFFRGRSSLSSEELLPWDFLDFLGHC